MPVVVKTKTVPELGVGRPDYSREIWHGKTRHYKNFTLDLNEEREDEVLGLEELAVIADSMTVIMITPGATFSYKLNDASNDLTPAVAGQQETDFEIEGIYISNTPQGADTQTIIRVNYNPLRMPPEGG